MARFSSLKLESLLNSPASKQTVKATTKAIKKYNRKSKEVREATIAKHKAASANYKPYQDKDLDYFLNPQSSTSKPQKLKKATQGVRQTSLGEKLIADWLLKNGIRFKREKQFDDLINPLTYQKLWIDFYLHSLKVVIEFDGRQHFKASKMFDRNGDSLEARQNRDRIKDHYCKQKGLTMIRISYKEINNIPEILTKYLLNNAA